ncbi:MAG: hypothetical protein KC776_43205 [Myxococcales bacterium]|nr:hypothetical protein [Myxococcales bacterium]MCB9582338.1 hypothetical protein [Polyangiaceae bacterium]
MRNPWYCLAAIATLVAVSGCDKKSTDAAPSAVPSASGPPAAALPPPMKLPPPSGPRLAILAGQGLGPIRLHAKVETVERHMQAPCEVRTPKLCRYIHRAAEFLLDDEGRVRAIHVHRVGRSAGTAPDGGTLIYGVFNGAIPPDLAFGMLPTAIQQQLGPPKKVIPGDAGATPGTVEQHVYDGMVIEYDRMPNGQLVMGGVRIPD